MKATYVLAALVAAVSAQDLSSIPSCVTNCLVKAVPATGCGLTDFKCVCQHSSALTTQSTTDCITSGCSADDQAKAGPALTSFCAAAGVTVTIPPIGGSAPASSAPASSAAPASSQPAKSSAAPASSAPASYSASKPAASSKPAESSAAPCSSTVTVTVTKPSGAPYPTGGASVPSYPTGTAAPSGPAAKTSGTPAQYTGAASSVDMPLALAGVVGIAAMLF